MNKESNFILESLVPSVNAWGGGANISIESNTIPTHSFFFFAVIPPIY
jgi:hypothetical protein